MNDKIIQMVTAYRVSQAVYAAAVMRLGESRRPYIGRTGFLAGVGHFLYSVQTGKNRLGKAWGLPVFDYFAE